VAAAPRRFRPLAQQQRPPGAGLQPAPVAREGRVLHLTTYMDAGVLQLLGPATAALARSGSDQTVVLIDHLHSRPLLTQLDDSTDIVLVPPRRNPLAQWRALGAAFASTLLEQRPDAVHLHGFVACLLGERALGGLALQLPAFYSPHGSGALGAMRPLATLAHLLGRSGKGSATARAIAHGTAEAQVLEGLIHRSVALLEGPVDRAYFEVELHAARHPLIVTASRSGDARCAEAFDQLAVLLGGDGLGLAFNWIGPADAVSVARLKAANVGVFDAATHGERATRLAAAWIFVALASERGFPLCLAEAMGAGLPCVALDTPAHRGLVEHGNTGYLCRSMTEVIDRIAQLADTPSLRERMGRAGRALASQRFGQAQFEDTLMAAYAANGALRRDHGGASAVAPAARPRPPAQDISASADRS
jgi:glycosyltransferase involved in cell wall biosynthesis